MPTEATPSAKHTAKGSFREHLSNVQMASCPARIISNLYIIVSEVKPQRLEKTKNEYTPGHQFSINAWVGASMTAPALFDDNENFPF